MTIPTLITKRLVLRPFVLADVARVQLLAGDPVMTEMTLTIPYPYHVSLSESWIKNHAHAFKQGKSLILAVVLAESNILIGAISLMNISKFHLRAEIGYWIGIDYWRQGYCQEAVRCIVKYGFDQLLLNRIEGSCLSCNTASAKVLVAADFEYEGERKKQIKIKNKFEDVHYFGIIAESYFKER